MKRIYLTLVILVLSVGFLKAQNNQSSATKYVFTLDDIVRLAKEQSNDGIMARHSFRASYYSFRAYKSDYLPKLTLTANPTTYNHSIKRVEYIDTLGNYKVKDASVNTLTSSAGLSLSQNIGLTGAEIFLESGFSRIQDFDDLSDKSTQFTTFPIRFRITQSLNGYNELKWNKRIEPLKFEEAKQNYIVEMEKISSKAVNYFFALALAQITLNMASINYTNTGELYEIAKGRYNIGTIAEDALLQMELRYMNAESELTTAKIDIEVMQSQLRSFLGFKDNVDIQLQIDPSVPALKIQYDKALDYALTRSPNIISYNRQLLEAEKNVADMKSRKGVTIGLNGSVGFDQKGYAFKDAYAMPFNDQEIVNLEIRIPILDWNQAKDRYRNAQSLLEVVDTRVKQEETDFRQDIYLQVMQFNIQEKQVQIAAKADTIAQKGYEVSRQRYLIGKVSVTDLNIADTDKDSAKSRYVRALQAYWNLYYTVRRLTLFDFMNDKPLEEDFSKLVGE